MFGTNIIAEKVFCRHQRFCIEWRYLTAREYLFVTDEGKLVEDRVVFTRKQLKKI